MEKWFFLMVYYHQIIALFSQKEQTNDITAAVNLLKQEVQCDSVKVNTLLRDMFMREADQNEAERIKGKLQR